jgi:serine/threonine protein kinase
MFLGSPVYASPENCKGEPLDERSDIYSLGLILYEMVGGRRAFEDRGFLNLLNSHAYETPPPLMGIPKALADLTLSALEKDPALRPQSAKEFAENLRDLELGTMQSDENTFNVEPECNRTEIQDIEETVVARRQAESDAIHDEVTIVKTHSARHAVIHNASTPLQSRTH